MKTYFIVLLLAFGVVTPIAAQASGDHGHDAEQEENHKDESDHDHDEGIENHTDQSGDHDNDSGHEDTENSTNIRSEIASQVGIETGSAQEKTLHQQIISYGVLTTGPEQLSHMRARFSGLITSVKVNIGDFVKTGDLLAQIESDESFKTYSVRAPISGVVVQRHANKGEVTKEQVLFSIANFNTLWAEFRIYPMQMDNVSVGQSVEIVSNEKRITGTINHIVPALNKPYQLARVKINNSEIGLSPGLLVEGRIVTGEFSVSIAVDKDAIQELGERSGVFIKEGDSYHFTPLVVGRSDDHFVEVISGLDENDVYVIRNSYLIKADIEKSEAEHEH